MAVGAWFPLSTESSTVAREARYCDAEVQDVHICEWLFLAWVRGGDATSLEFRVESSECCKVPKTNRDFWVAKIRRNQERDTRVQHELATMGWHSITIWECELKPKVRERTLLSLVYQLDRLFLHDRSVKRYDAPEEEYVMAAEDIE